MDRKILYRGKQLDNGQWVEGCYVNCFGPGCRSNETRHYIVGYPDRWHEVYTATVGQYTGLKDRSGKRIFEGDICIWIDNNGEYDANCKYVVSWEQEETGFFLQIYDNGEDCGLDYFGDGRDGLEVVGNIHDNPALLGTIGQSSENP